mmetsp:Transcript_118447/g.205737  ORF Transcript_118447/g.205737 Transcript_118447/m.205737 type:complete len:95 (+) Transcript_118447:296-580(+)
MFRGLALRGSSLVVPLSDSALCWARGELSGDARALLSRTERDEALREAGAEAEKALTESADPAPTVAVTAPDAIETSCGFLAQSPCGVTSSKEM